MSHSVPDKEALGSVWEAVKNRSIPLKSLTKAEYDVLDETSKNADVAYLVRSAIGLSLMCKEVDLIPNPVRGVYTQDEFDEFPEELKNRGVYIIRGDGSGSGGSVTMDDVNTAIRNTVGDINAILDSINGEVV